MVGAFSYLSRLYGMFHMRLNSAISCFDSFGPPHGLPWRAFPFRRFERFDAYPGEMTHVHGQILAVRSDACISAGATEQRVADGGKPRDAGQRPAEDYRHGQVVTRHTPVIPRLPHGFPILDDVQAAPLADGDNEGTRFRDERAKPCCGLRSRARGLLTPPLPFFLPRRTRF